MSVDPFLGEIALFSFDFAPAGWAKCDGSLLPIAQNNALYALLGTRYGGDGNTTFGLPDLRGRVPIGEGHGHKIGESGGFESVTLTDAQIPPHTHKVAPHASKRKHITDAPHGNVPAKGGAYDHPQHQANSTTMAASTTDGGSVGGKPHSNMQPYLAMNYCISLQGTYLTQ